MAIFVLFKIDLLNYVKVKSILAKEFHIQPSEIDMMPAWEYELFLKEINNAVKEENEKQQKELDKAGYNDAKKMSDPSSISKIQRSYTNSLPSMNYISNMSDVSMPKMPSMPSGFNKL